MRRSVRSGVSRRTYRLKHETSEMPVDLGNSHLHLQSEGGTIVLKTPGLGVFLTFNDFLYFDW